MIKQYDDAVDLLIDIKKFDEIAAELAQYRFHAVVDCIHGMATAHLALTREALYVLVEADRFPTEFPKILAELERRGEIFISDAGVIDTILTSPNGGVQ
jgi:hypothetical protein